MDNLTAAKADAKPHIAAAKRGQTWVLSFLYIGTFGSFIGYSAALPLLIKTQFPLVHGASYAWLGAAVGSLSRPYGGWLADRFGGARVTAATFVGMALCAAVVPMSLAGGSFPLFLLAFLLLFVTSGIGNGSTYRMIPALFASTVDDAHPVAPKQQAAAAIGIASSIGAFGGFFINRGFAMSMGSGSGGSIATAMFTFAGFYVLCVAVTWFCYLRTRVPATRMAVGI
jgi:NNP family nitrate/nitrite transporter-like MFS transporter